MTDTATPAPDEDEGPDTTPDAESEGGETDPDADDDALARARRQ